MNKYERATHGIYKYIRWHDCPLVRDRGHELYQSIGVYFSTFPPNFKRLNNSTWSTIKSRGAYAVKVNVVHSLYHLSQSSKTGDGVGCWTGKKEFSSYFIMATVHVHLQMTKSPLIELLIAFTL